MTHYVMVIDLKTCTGCQACVAACTLENQTPYWDGKYRTHVEDVVHGQFPTLRRVLAPRLCMHCDEPPCVDACPTGASYQSADGMVLLDAEKCIGCKACIAACPYQARYVYSADDVKQAREIYGEATNHAAPHVDKCTFCAHRVAQGLEPACVSTCLGHARIFGDLDDAQSEVAKLVATGKARPLRTDVGTDPKVYYLSDI